MEPKDTEICVTSDGVTTSIPKGGTALTPSGLPETWGICQWFEKTETPGTLPALIAVQYIAADFAVAFEETFDADGNSTGTTGTKPLVFTRGACAMPKTYCFDAC